MFWQTKKIIEKPKRIFLDYASTTPMASRVVEAMAKLEQEAWANPSALYSEAIFAKDKMIQARTTIAGILLCRKDEIVFTSGGTEGNNLALLGVFEAHKTKNFTPHFVTTMIEHSSILETFREVERRGGEVTYIPVSSDGLVSVKSLREAIQKNTVLVSVMYANNEIGTLQPIREIGRMIQEYRREQDSQLPYLHTDACQAALYCDLNIQKIRADLVTLDGIKMYGPRGAGILYIKSDTKIKPVLFGGGQEKGLRSGTENTGSAVGLATALKIATELCEKESARLLKIRDYAIENILKEFPSATLNGSHEHRLPNNINICFKGLDAEFAVVSLDVLGIACSYSSSCQTLKDDSSSYIVEALGKPDCKSSSLRFTLGRDTVQSDIDALLLALRKIVR